MSYKLIILIPFYNHAHEFSKMAKDIVALNFPVLVVNDESSKDETKKVKEICKSYDFHYLELLKNSGKGSAFLEGVKYSINNGFTHVLQIDADGQHNFLDIPKFVAFSKENPSSLINGYPKYDKTVPKSRLYGRKITNFWVRIETLSKDIKDAMCGFRVYPLKEIEKILKEIRFKRMGFDIEIIVKARINRVSIINLETKVVYPKDGVSHFNMLKDNIEITFLHTMLCFYAIYKLVYKLVYENLYERFLSKNDLR
ncbi:MAG: glycosyltransferase family 2 protein [Bdellovibrionota bacterium]